MMMHQVCACWGCKMGIRRQCYNMFLTVLAGVLQLVSIPCQHMQLHTITLLHNSHNRGCDMLMHIRHSPKLER